MLEQELTKANEHIAWLSQLAGAKIQKGATTPQALPREGSAVELPVPASPPKMRRDQSVRLEREGTSAVVGDVRVAAKNQRAPAGIETRVDTIMNGVFRIRANRVCSR